jgi:hypothetical protein
MQNLDLNSQGDDFPFIDSYSGTSSQIEVTVSHDYLLLPPATVVADPAMDHSNPLCQGDGGGGLGRGGC